MNKKAHYNPKSRRWLISLAIMLVLSICVIVGTIVISDIAERKSSDPVELGFTISTTIPIAVQENELNITGVEKALDEKNNLVAYVIKGSTIGYNQEVPIEMATTITPDAGIVCGIEILNQEETEYLGVRIQEDSFKNQFIGKKLPVKDAASISKGSSVDLIARSTVSSQAVVDGVNNAQQYVKDNLAE